MQPPTHKATFIARLWTDKDQVDDNNWPGTAELIGSGQPRQFHSLDKFIIWLRMELAKTEEKSES
jgi:hypothetical protein